MNGARGDAHPLRIGAVSFLNSVPLIEGLQHDRDVMLLRDLPSRLADLLYDGRIDVGLIPVVEYLRGVGSDIVPGICIASHGAVHTVKVFSRVPLQQASSIAVDRGSRSSVAMLRVLLAERFDHHPDLHVVEPQPDDLFLHHDTVLVIGDRAEQVPASDVPHVYDLGALWQEFTGLPFVYAAWVLSPELSRPEHSARRSGVIERLAAAKREGLAGRKELARAESERRHVPVDAILHYWNEVIGYDLGDAELEGLSRFAELAFDHNLCPVRQAVSLAEA